MNLTTLSIGRPITTTMVFAALLLVGIVSMISIPVDLMPDVDFPVITIETQVPGYSAEEIENEVTKPVEAMVSIMNHVHKVRSTSGEGLSQVRIAFDLGTDMDWAAADVWEKISLIRDTFPKDARNPHIRKYNPSDAPVAVLSVHGKLPAFRQRQIVEEKIEKQIERIKGVGNVSVKGGRKREIIVEVDRGRLQALGLSITHIAEILKSNNLNMQVGSLRGRKSRFVTRVVGEYRDLMQIRRLAVGTTPAGSLVHLGDVAQVTDSLGKEEHLIRFQGEPRIMVTIQKESSANILNISKVLHSELAGLKGQLGKMMTLNIIYDQATFVRKAIDRLRDEAIYGGILAIAVIFLFLRNIQGILIIGMSIPVSIIITFALMYLFGISLNVISLSGFTLGVGMLVDNSIVVIENIFRKRQEGYGGARSSVIGTGEVIRAITISTFAHIAVFFPVIFLQKKIRMFYSGLFFTVSFSLLASLAVALTLIPLLSSRLNLQPLWSKGKGKSVYRKYRHLLIMSLRNRGKIVTGGVVVFAASLLLIPKIGFRPLGQVDRGEFTMVVRTPPGTRLRVTDADARKIERFLLHTSGVEDVSTEVSAETARLRVRLAPLEERDISTRDFVEALRQRLPSFPEADIHFDIERHSSTGNKILLAVNGYDQTKLTALAFQVKKRMNSLPEISDVVIHQANPEPEMQIKILHDKAALYGLNAKSIARAVRSSVTGPIATEYIEKGKEVDLRVRSRRSDVADLSLLRNMVIPVRISSEQSVSVPLSEVCSFHFIRGVKEIHRTDQRRTIDISAEIGRSDLANAVARVEKQLKDISFPQGYSYEFGENYREMKKSEKEMLFAFSLAVLLVYMILASLFESFVLPLTVMFSVPMAAVGSILILFLSGKSISMPVYVGAITLAGIVVNNGIVLLDYINFLGSGGMGKWRAIVRGGERRLRPILMTSATTVLALLPMALDRGEGSNLWSPLALTIIGGLVVSTTLTLITLPVLYSFVGRIRPRISNLKSTSENIEPRTLNVE
jgi:hydrophobic/amphiphilic exporter-1 (mainly G- bacteria), HAE1 family